MAKFSGSARRLICIFHSLSVNCLAFYIAHPSPLFCPLNAISMRTQSGAATDCKKSHDHPHNSAGLIFCKIPLSLLGSPYPPGTGKF